MIETATDIKYLPRNTTYHIVKHSVSIKTEGGWKEGFLYCADHKLSDTSVKFYTRPYEMFDESKWEILK